jgi:hypothetical protein
LGNGAKQTARGQFEDTAGLGSQAERESNEEWKGRQKMKVPELTEVVDGICYSTNVANLLATDDSDDPVTASEKKTYLLRGTDGRYFAVYSQLRKFIRPLTRDEAQRLYVTLPCKHIDFDAAFSEITPQEPERTTEETLPAQARRDKSRGMQAAAMMALKVGFVAALLATALSPNLGVFIGVAFGVLTLLAYMNAAKSYLVGGCPYCGHSVGHFMITSAVFSCKHCKSKITVQNDQFHRLQT